MTRFILTSATLAACLAAGVPLASPSHLPSRADRIGQRTAPVDPLPMLTIGGQAYGLQIAGRSQPGSTLGVSLILPPDRPAPDRISVWAGRKNGWGAQPGFAEAVPGWRSVLVATVPIPDPLPDQARLWIAVEQGTARPARASVPLPGV